MVQQHSSELRAQEDRVVQLAAAGEISESVAKTMDLYAGRLEALETVSNEIHWTEQASSSGTRYYYNTKTKQSTWERPAAFQPAIKSTETLVETVRTQPILTTTRLNRRSLTAYFGHRASRRSVRLGTCSRRSLRTQ